MSGRPTRERKKVNYASYFEKGSDEESDEEKQESGEAVEQDDFEPSPQTTKKVSHGSGHFSRFLLLFFFFFSPVSSASSGDSGRDGITLCM